jgi:GTP-binding protein
VAFIDETEITVRSGDGGPGMVSFKSAKNAPKLGPDGGDGGFGGSVYLVGKAQLNSLSGLYYRRRYAAEHGAKGGTNNCTGRNGEDLEIPVPIGTQAYDRQTGKLIAEVLEDGQRICLAPGGKRGLGNIRFLSATHQAPHESTSGGEGVELELKLELKLIADVGFAGFPNAGKSTLLSSISAARPKIADYPFTTLIPQLGVVSVPEMDEWGNASFVAADIPGLIEGASEGKGLGHEFLRHLERTKIVVYVIDPFSLDEMPPLDAYETLENELRSFSESLANKKHLIALTKSDIAPEDFDWDEVEAPLKERGLEVLRVSAVARDGINDFKRRVWTLVQEEKQKVEVVEAPVIPKRADEEGYIWMSRASEDQDFGI